MAELAAQQRPEVLHTGLQLRMASLEMVHLAVLGMATVGHRMTDSAEAQIVLARPGRPGVAATADRLGDIVPAADPAALHTDPVV